MSSRVPPSAAPPLVPSSPPPSVRAVPALPPSESVSPLFCPGTGTVLTHASMLPSSSSSLEVSELCDVELLMLDKTAVLRCHYFIVSSRWPKMLEALFHPASSSGRMRRFKQNKADNAPLSANAMRQILSLLYCGTLAMESVDLHVLRELMHQLQLVPPGLMLQTEVELALIKVLSVENMHQAVQLFPTSKIVLSFAFRNWQQFVMSKDGCKSLGIELMQTLSAQQADAVRNPEPPKLPVRANSNLLLDWYRSLFVTKQMTDCVFACSDNVEIEAHRALVHAACPKLVAMVGVSSGLRSSSPRSSSPRFSGPPQPSKIKFDVPVASKVLRSMLQFIYAGVVAFGEEDCLEIAVASVYLNYPPLLAVAEGMIFQLDVSLDNCAKFLLLSYRPELCRLLSAVDLRAKCLNFVCQNFACIDLGPILSSVDEKAKDLILALQKHEKRMK